MEMETSNKGTGTRETGNPGTGNRETANLGTGSMENDNLGTTAYKETGKLGTGNRETANLGTGSLENDNLGTTACNTWTDTRAIHRQSRRRRNHARDAGCAHLLQEMLEYRRFLSFFQRLHVVLPGIS